MPNAEFIIRFLDTPAQDNVFPTASEARAAFKNLQRPNAGMSINAELWIHGERMGTFKIRQRDNR